MKARKKKLLSMLLAVSMIFSIGNMAAAEEIHEDTGVIDSNTPSWVGWDKNADHNRALYYFTKDGIENGLPSLSSNAYWLAFLTVSSQLGGSTGFGVREGMGGDKAVFIEYPANVAYDGREIDWEGNAPAKKGKKKGISINIYYTENYDSRSMSLVTPPSVSDDGTADSKSGWKKLDPDTQVASIKIKSPKGVTYEVQAEELGKKEEYDYCVGVEEIYSPAQITKIKLKNLTGDKKRDKEINAQISFALKSNK